MKKAKLLLVIIAMIASYSLTAQMAVTTDGSSADASAMLEVKSNVKGFLPPRMTKGQRDNIDNPATGLVIFNTTTNCLDFFNSTKWISICETGIVVQNMPPTVSNVSFSGALVEGETLTGSYTYSDEENDLEDTSTFKWYRADDASGTNQTTISGASSLTYMIVAADVDKYISFEVTPLAQTGGTPGVEIVSAIQGFVFGTVYNSTTGETWMDRNMGASRVATSIHDDEAYGDFYQWGRLKDGHQDRSSTTTTTLSSTDNPGHSYYITNETSPQDWRSSKNDNLWQGVNGINNPCPNGFHVPTMAEWSAEVGTWSSANEVGGYNSPLKFVCAGYRNHKGQIGDVNGGNGSYWSSDINGIAAKNLYVTPNTVYYSSRERAHGKSIRCIMD